MRSKVLLLMLVGILLFPLVIGDCVLAKEKKEITVASFNFTEPVILAEIVKQLVEANTDIQVKHIPNMEFRVAVEATQTGDVDLYLTYSGTQFTTVLKHEITEEWLDPKKVLEAARREVNEKYDMTMMPPLGFDNTYAVAVRREFAQKHNIRTISDLKPYASDMIMATDADFLHREEVMSYQNFQKVYQLPFKKAIAMTYGLLYRAIRNGDVDAIMAYSSDGRIAAMNLQVLEDDKHFFPPYDAMLIVRNKTLAKYPELYDVLDKLSGRLDQETIQRLNAAADVHGEEPADIARDFLKKEGLID